MPVEVTKQARGDKKLTFFMRSAAMRCFRVLLGLAVMVTLTLVCTTNTTLGSSGISGEAARHWTADNGNGTYSNPLFYEEFEDPDPIRVGNDYYLAGTTMHMMPAVMVMHSKDLVNWELASYCTEKLDLGPAYRLEGGNIYGRGIWAPCMRYHNGTFYVFSNVNGAQLQVFSSKSANGPWEHNTLPGRHDLSVLFDDDLNKIFIISGAGAPYPIEELTPDLKGFVPNVRHQLAPQGGRMGEGHHLYKIKGKYYDVSAIPGGAVNQVVARADSIDGPWTVTTMVDGESLGISANPARTNAGDRGVWLHQGGMCDTPSGEWWSIIMSDHGSAGRMVALVPITWDNDFPLIGLPGNLRKAPNTWLKPETGVKQDPKPAFIHSDNFDSGKLITDWQWNHVPDANKWSLTEKPGVLRLHSLPADSFYNARNSLCQRPPSPESIMTVELNTSGMVAGDTAGLGLLSTPYAWIGVVKSAEGTSLQWFQAAAPGGRGGRRGNTAAPANTPVMGPNNPPTHLWLRVTCNFDTDRAIFSWSADGKQFTTLGNPFTTTFQLTTFQGVRPALFHYNTSGQPGGYVDFDNYTVDEPRARGIEREIPAGKTIVLTSGADGSFLAADTQNNKLVNVAGDPNKPPQEAKFQVIDVGLGRVALKTANGKFVSVASPDSVVLKDLAGAKPGDAESFQWVNLMRGDTMLMTLTNHQYLATKPNLPVAGKGTNAEDATQSTATKPNSPGAVTANALGATPARKSGAEFKWKAVE
jgi:xylan 1,4-beta-xylosidase